jgi:hypothetical protein
MPRPSYSRFFTRMFGEQHKSYVVFSTPPLLRALWAQISSLAPYSWTTFLPQYWWETKVSHPYKTTGKILVLYILFFIFMNNKLEDKRFCTEW